jgi:hypothetical protein
MAQDSELLLQAMDKKPLDEATADKAAESLTAKPHKIHHIIKKNNFSLDFFTQIMYII